MEVPATKDSPCIALCSTALGDPVCRGCGRTFYEVADWCVLDTDEKRQIWQRLPERMRLVEIGLHLDGLIDLETDGSGVEWARLVREKGLTVYFRLQREDAGLTLLVRRGKEAPTGMSLATGTAASAKSFAALLEQVLLE